MLINIVLPGGVTYKTNILHMLQYPKTTFDRIVRIFFMCVGDKGHDKSQVHCHQR